MPTTSGMCGRVTLYADPQAVAALFSIPEPTFEWGLRYNIAPTQSVVACRASTAGGRELDAPALGIGSFMGERPVLRREGDQRES